MSEDADVLIVEGVGGLLVPMDATHTVRDTREQRAASWRSVPVADGIEIHVRDDAPAARDEALVAMREAVCAALGRADIR